MPPVPRPGRSCSHCKLTKPISEFYVGQPSDKRPDGVYEFCKACLVETNRKSHARAAEARSRAKRIRRKVCPTCKVERLRMDFTHSTLSADGLSVECRYCSRNRAKTEKTCTKCLNVMPVSQFTTSCRKPDGYDIWCKCCRSNHHTKVYIKHKYGLTADQQKELLAKQAGVCSICGKEESTVHFGKLLRLSVDHDHKSGKVRGFLCYMCNHLVGHMERSGYLTLSRALEYLEEHGTPLGSPDGYVTQRKSDKVD